MQSICFYLATLSRIEPADRVIKRAVGEAITMVTGIVVDEGAVKVSGKTVHISAHPLVKTELYVRREEVSAYLHKLLADRRLLDIY
jgi:hypothetical protein